MRSALERLGFSADAATAVCDQQDIDELDELKVLTDKEVENLCKVVRRPGGTIADPANPGQLIPNPGHQVSMRAENNLKLACYYVRHQERVSRTPQAIGITLQNVRRLRNLRDVEESHSDPEDSPKIDAENWPKTLEALEEYLRGFLGTDDVPLSYVIREAVDVPAANLNPAAGQPNSPYETVEQEMIERAPHHDGTPNQIPTESYLADRTKVWEIISGLTRDHACWTHVKPAQRHRDGRMAFRRLWDHYLGPNNVDNMANAAETRLENVTYSAERKRWNFEKYVKAHLDQHQILEGLVKYGYAGVDERSKVRHLMNGIKTDKLDSVKTQILSDAALRGDFNRCVTLYKDFIKQTIGKAPDEVNISGLGTKGGGGGGQGGARQKQDENSKVEDRYYTAKEYSKLSSADKRRLRELREAREPARKKRKTQQGASAADVTSLVRSVSALTAALTDKDEDGDATMEEAGAGDAANQAGAAGGNNRTHPALTRQRKGTKGPP